MCTNWQERRLKHQLLIVFLSISVAALAVVGITTLVTMIVVTGGVSEQIESDLLAQSSSDRNETLYYSSELFDGKLTKLPQSFLNIMCYLAESATRTDYPFGAIPSYSGWNRSTLAQPSAFNNRYNTFVSFEASSYNVFNKRPEDSLQGTTQIRLDHSASTDSTMRALYQAYFPSFLAGYQGYFTEGLFREYPGATSSNQAELLAYDPRNEDWFTSANDAPTQMVYTEPYFDEFVQQTMISMSRVMRDIETPNSIIGACGADMIIGTVSAAIRDIKYLGTGRTILFDVAQGLIVADSNGAPAAGATYESLMNPSISSATWASLSVGGASLSVGSYDLQSNLLDAAGGSQYVIVTIIPRSVVTSRQQPLLDSISSVRDQYYATSAVAFVIVLIVISLIIVTLANRLIAPVDRLVEATKKIVRNVGGADMSKGINLNEFKASSQVAEIDDLQRGFVNLVESKQLMARERKDTQPGSANALYDPSYVRPVGIELASINLPQVQAPPQFHNSSDVKSDFPESKNPSAPSIQIDKLGMPVGPNLNPYAVNQGGQGQQGGEGMVPLGLGGLPSDAPPAYEGSTH